MPVYEYEGKFYELEGTLSNEEALSKIKASLSPTPAVQPKEQAGIGSELLRQLGLTGRAAYQAFTAPANVVLEAGRGAYNLMAPEGRQIPSIAEAESRMLTNVGLPEPANMLERGVMAGTQAMAGAGGMARAFPNVSALASD